jgi:hypothetical protein
MPRTRATPPTSVYRVLVTLQRIEPAIWRRLVLVVAYGRSRVRPIAARRPAAGR